MTKKKSTKRALISSLLILAMCFTMLAGTTFAWFTDSVTSGNNRILAGKLKVDLLMDKAADGTYVSIAGEEGDIFNSVSNIAQNDPSDTLWEPNKTQIVYLAVENKGNLALKYNIILDITDAGLAPALQYAIVDGAKATDFAAATAWEDITAQVTASPMPGTGRQIAAPNGKLAAGATDYFALAVHMDKNAGNEYQEKLFVLDVAVVATQATVEEDSFSDQYDALAELPVIAEPNRITDDTALLDKLTNATEPQVIEAAGADLAVLANETINVPVTIQNANFDTTGTNANVNMYNVDFKKEVTFKNCKFDSYWGVYTNQFENGVVFENCDFTGDWSAFYNNKVVGNATFDNCTFSSEQAYAINFANVTGTLTIKNCDISGWNSFGGSADTAVESKVIIDNCTFHKSTRGYGTLRFYQDGEVKNCTFDSDFQWIDSNMSGVTVKIDNCTGIDASKIFNNGSTVSTFILDGTTLSGVASH